MRICCLSDIHGYLPTIPDCDLLLLAGDYCRDHNYHAWYGRSFARWIAEIANRGIKVVGVAGNHDFIFEQREDFSIPHWTYLQDSGFRWNGLNIWGTPWQPRFYDWAFNLDEPELEKKWSLIPDDTDILILHGPPYGYGDRTEDGRRTGSSSLTKRIKEVKPKLVVCGHIHCSHGVIQMLEQDTVIVNAAYVDEEYRPANKPIMVEISPPPARTP